MRNFFESLTRSTKLKYIQNPSIVEMTLANIVSELPGNSRSSFAPIPLTTGICDACAVIHWQILATVQFGLLVDENGP